MDTNTFASLAQVQILLHPVGATPQAAFEKYASEIRSFETIRLSDIPADHKDEKASRFMPSPLAPGSLQIRFATHPPPQNHAPLSLLRPSHFPFAVIGVASCEHSDSLQSLKNQFKAAVSDIFPEGSLYPFKAARHLFVFEEGDTANSEHIMESLPNVSVIPSLLNNKKLYIGTLLADICSQILRGFGELSEKLESPLGNEYLNSSLMPELPPLQDIPSPLNESSSSRPDSTMSLPSFNSQPEISRPFTLSAAPGTLKRNSTTTGAYRQSSLLVPAAKKRLSTIGMSSPLGRLYKMFGDFCLLSGMTEDSSKWYSEAISVFKANGDNVWYASALEGLATIAVIDAWSAGQGLHSSTATAKEPWGHIGERLAQATALYHKTSTPDSEQIHSLLVYLYCLCVLRHTSLYFATWSAKGWGPLAFTAMLHPGPKPYLPPTLAHDGSRDWVALERLSHISNVSRSTISAILSNIHGPWLLHLGARERISVLETTASIYSSMGFRRKEAFILREILGSLMDLIVCGRDEEGMSQPNAGALQTGGLGIHNMTPGPSQSWGAVGVRLSERTQGNESILFVLKYLCRTLGINLEAVKLHASLEDPNTIEDGALIAQYEQEETEVFQEPFGWPELQVGIIREAVAVAEALPDYPCVAQFSLSALKTLRPYLDADDQDRLHAKSVEALRIAVRRGDRRCIEYWSGKPVLDITLAPLPTIRLPIEKPLSMLHSKSNSVPLLLQGGTDPFLYNPRRAQADKTASLVVQNEPLEFLVTLTNPYIFDLELQHLSLSTSGVDFETQPMHYFIPANSTMDVLLTGKPLETGTLTIRGCFVQAPGGMMREFILPLNTEQELERITKKRNALACEFERYKYWGLESFPWQKAGRRESKQMAIPSISSFKFLQCKVVPEQPLLRIRRTTVTHGALMLYDGERSFIRLTLENISAHSVDFLRLVFDDSTQGPAQQALADGELSVFDTYETEYSLINAPVFSWKPAEAKVIAPNQNLTLTVDCFGKVGCTSGTVHISYSYTERDESKDSRMFYVRQVSYPLAVTVYHMLECHAMDIMPFPSYVNHADFHERLKGGKRKDLVLDDKWGWCLFSVEVRNAYGLPFDVTFSRMEDGEAVASTSTTLPPGSMSRIILPIRKIILPEEAINKPIPTLSDRQFVVAKSDLTKAEQKVQQELFWYREELFKSIRGEWQETGGIRSGILSLRDQRMTMHMLDTVRLEAAKVELTLVSRESDDPIPVVGGRYMPLPNQFVALQARVENLAEEPVVFTMDLELDPVESIVFEGILNDIPLGRLGANEVRDFSLGVCFLSSGRFDLSAQVRPFGIPHLEARAARTSLVAYIVDP